MSSLSSYQHNPHFYTQFNKLESEQRMGSGVTNLDSPQTTDTTMEETYFRLFATRNKHCRSRNASKIKTLNNERNAQTSPYFNMNTNHEKYQHIAARYEEEKSSRISVYSSCNNNEQNSKDEVLDLLNRAEQQIRDRDQKIEELTQKIWMLEKVSQGYNCDNQWREKSRFENGQELEELRKKLDESNSQSSVLYCKIGYLQEELWKVKQIFIKINDEHQKLAIKEREMTKKIQKQEEIITDLLRNRNRSSGGNFVDREIRSQSKNRVAVSSMATSPFEVANSQVTAGSSCSEYFKTRQGSCVKDSVKNSRNNMKNIHQQYTFRVPKTSY